MALLPTVPFSSGLYEIRKDKNMKVVKRMPLTVYSLSQSKNKINFFKKGVAIGAGRMRMAFGKQIAWTGVRKSTL